MEASEPWDISEDFETLLKTDSGKISSEDLQPLLTLPTPKEVEENHEFVDLTTYTRKYNQLYKHCNSNWNFCCLLDRFWKRRSFVRRGRSRSAPFQLPLLFCCSEHHWNHRRYWDAQFWWIKFSSWLLRRSCPTLQHYLICITNLSPLYNFEWFVVSRKIFEIISSIFLVHF